MHLEWNVWRTRKQKRTRLDYFALRKAVNLSLELMYKHRHTTKTNLLTVKLSERVEKEFLMMNTYGIPNGNNGTKKVEVKEVRLNGESYKDRIYTARRSGRSWIIQTISRGKRGWIYKTSEIMTSSVRKIRNHRL